MVYLYSLLYKKIAENNADILQNRDKAYQSEKGKNLATKEDIEEITKKVEEVKTEVSLAQQQKYNLLIEQKQLLVDILNDVTRIMQAQNKLLLYLYDTSSRKRLDELVEYISNTLTHFYHICNLIRVIVLLEDIDKRIEELSINVTLFSSHISVTATNAANLINQYNSQFDYVINKTTTEQDKATFLKKSLETKKQIVSMQNIANPYKDELQSELKKYLAWLKQLYGKDFFSFK